MKKRMTLTFKSKKGNEYLYDDSTGLILPWSKEDEKILKQLLEGNKTEDILKDGDVHESKVHYLSYLLDQTGAFLEECDIRVKYPGEEEIVDFIGSNLARQLILSVTDDCNLRCKYCIYSDAYHLTKDKSCKYMTEETAKRAIEWSQLLEKKIKEKCPLCIIEWFYDKNNLQGQKKSIARVEIYLIQVIHDLYFYGKVFHFYIRIHKYKDWYVVRIFTKKSLSQKLINKINKKLRKNKITMVNVVYHNQYTVIKMIC